jgi:hypothetical protein
MARLLYPREDRIGERQIPLIRFHVINEDAGVQSDPALAAEEYP